MTTETDRIRELEQLLEYYESVDRHRATLRCINLDKAWMETLPARTAVDNITTFKLSCDIDSRLLAVCNLPRLSHATLTVGQRHIGSCAGYLFSCFDEISIVYPGQQVVLDVITRAGTLVEPTFVFKLRDDHHRN